MTQEKVMSERSPLHAPASRSFIRLATFTGAFVLYALSTLLTDDPQDWNPEELVFVVLRGLVAGGIVLFAVPGFLQQRKYRSFFIVTALAIIVYATVEESVIDPIMFPPGSSEYTADLDGFAWAVLKSTLAVFTVTALVLFVDSLEMRRRTDELEKLKTAAELGALHQQLNPHILLNGLNNIYALAVARHDQTPQAILGLSDILRYALYETADGPVSLAREVELLRNFIHVQQLGLESRLEVHFTVTGPVDAVHIEPLLLLPLVENAFKHGTQTGADQVSDLVFTLSTDGAEIVFESANPVLDAPLADDTGGMGLDNIRARLDLLYPGRYSLQTLTKDQRFHASLTLKGHPAC